MNTDQRHCAVGSSPYCSWAVYALSGSFALAAGCHQFSWGTSCPPAYVSLEQSLPAYPGMLPAASPSIQVVIKRTGNGVDESTLRQWGSHLTQALCQQGLTLDSVLLTDDALPQRCRPAAYETIWQRPVAVASTSNPAHANHFSPIGAVLNNPLQPTLLHIEVLEYRPYVPQRLVVRVALREPETQHELASSAFRWQGETMPLTERRRHWPFFKRGPAAGPLPAGLEIQRISSAAFLQRASHDIALWVHTEQLQQIDSSLILVESWELAPGAAIPEPPGLVSEQLSSEADVSNPNSTSLIDLPSLHRSSPPASGVQRSAPNEPDLLTLPAPCQ